jgi:hypothetical protein
VDFARSAHAHLDRSGDLLEGERRPRSFVDARGFIAQGEGRIVTRSRETTVTDSGHAPANCPNCDGAVLLNVGEARERNEAAIEAQCDHCHSTIAVSWVEAA